MSERALRQLVGALAIAVAVWVVASIFSGGSGSIAASGDIATFFDAIDGQTVEALGFDRDGETVTLERGDGSWSVNGHPADSGSVARLTDVLGELEIGELIAANPENHERMGVSDGTATHVSFVVGGEEREILLGEAGRRFGTAYVRLPGEDEVYLLDGDLRAQATRDLDSWRNRTMVVLDSTGIARIEVDRGGDSYAVVRADSVWTFADGAEVDAPAVNGIVSELARLVASGFVAEGDSIAGLGLATTTRAFSADNELLAEITIGEGTGDRWARTASDDYVYRVSSFRAGRVAPSREDVAPSS